MIPPPPWVPSSLHLVVVATAVYMTVLAVYVLAMLGFAFWEGRHRRRQRDVEDYRALLRSRYTIPVSVIAPAYNEEVMVEPAVRSLLDLAYPEFEVIVVDDGSNDGTLAALKRAFDLEPRQVFFRNTLAAKPVRMVYRSRREPRLTVVSKENGGKADALNCGINFARYRYLLCVDGDTVYMRDALLTAMSQVVKDPGRILAAGSLFGISLEPEAGRDLANEPPRINRHLLADFQHLDLMRSFIAYRMGWTRLDCMLCVPGGFAIWRRDVIHEMGGFSSNFTCEDIEMTFRVHEKFLRERRPYRIISLPHMVAQTEGPGGIASLISQRARWQRVTLETIWHYRAMFARPRYRSTGMIGIPYYLFFECLAPLMQLLSVLALVVAIVFGLLGWKAYLAFVGIMIFGSAVPTVVAVGLHDAAFRDYRPTDIVRMLALGPLDLLLYRPILIYAGVRGTIEFLRGEKGWNKFARNARRASATAALAAAILGLAPQGSGAQTKTDPVDGVIHLLRTGRAGAANRLAASALASDSLNVDLLVLRAWALRQLNQQPAALLLAERAAQLSPAREDVRLILRTLLHDVHGTEVTIAGRFQDWSSAVPSWREGIATVQQNTTAGAFIVGFAHASRLGQSDQKVGFELYPRLWSGYAAVGAQFATQATLYPRSAVSATVYRSMPGGFEVSLGLRHMSFDNPVSVLGASIGRYVGPYLLQVGSTRITQGATGAYTGVLARRYYSDGIQYYGLVVGGGTSSEEIYSTADTDATSVRGIGLEGYFLFRGVWTLRLRPEIGREVTGDNRATRTRVTAGFGARF